MSSFGSAPPPPASTAARRRRPPPPPPPAPSTTPRSACPSPTPTTTTTTPIIITTPLDTSSSSHHGSPKSTTSLISTKGTSSVTSTNIQVVCRFRPARETDPFTWVTASKEHGYVQVRTPERYMDFSFDKVFDESTNQADVYASVRHVVTGLMEGYNGTVFSYGQTSSGKTWTMLGRLTPPPPFTPSSSSYEQLPPPTPSTHPLQDLTPDAGIIPRSIAELFAKVDEYQDTIEFSFKLSYIEIYCEKIRDLLDIEGATTNNSSGSGDLKLREDPQGGVTVVGASEVYVTSQEEIMKFIDLGQALRATSATRMNEESSRSHTVLLLTVTQKNTETLHVRRGKLVLVDLAGSERLAKTGAEGLRLEEAKNINRSLTSLGMVINALSDGKPHIPYRDSKLTRVLEESLGGNSRTCLIICCAPELHHSNESISTLRFGERAKRVKNRAIVNEELSTFELQLLLNRAMEEIAGLKAQIGLFGNVGGSGNKNHHQKVGKGGHVHVPVPVEEEKEKKDKEEEKKRQSSVGGGDSESDLVRELRSLLAAREEENSMLKEQCINLAERLAEEEAAVAGSLEEQQILQDRLREAEASMDQMMRGLAAAGMREVVAPPPPPSSRMASSSSSLLSKSVSLQKKEKEEQETAATTTTTITEEQTVLADEQGSNITTAALSPPMTPTKEATADTDQQELEQQLDISPGLKQIYEEKLLSTERVCIYLQDELDAQRGAFEQVNRALLTQNAQLAMQKDTHVRRIFSLEVKIEELEAAVRLMQDNKGEMEGGWRALLMASSWFRGSAGKSVHKTVSGGRKTTTTVGGNGYSGSGGGVGGVGLVAVQGGVGSG